ncbi:unnamed protein product, partial [Choristocarpus tenellus]
MRIKATTAGGSRAHRPSIELDPLRRSIVQAKDDAQFISAVKQVNAENNWEEQPDLYDWSDVLDRVDEALESGLRRDPSVLLIPVKSKEQNPAAGTPANPATVTEKGVETLSGTG